MGFGPFFFGEKYMLNRRADKLELLRIAEAVALEKSIDKELIINSMETGIAKAAKSKFGNENEITVNINRDNGDIQIFRKEDLVSIDIKATGFLYGMVRSIVGQLVLVGEKKISPELFYERWINKRKEEVLESAPAKGLCFVNSVYERNVFKKFNRNDLFPKFLISGFS